MPRLPYREQILADHLKEHGWFFVSLERGFFTYEHPLCREEIPTPDGVRHWYDFPTYQPLRQISFAAWGQFITSRTGTPWQGAQQRSLSLPKALAFIAEEFTP